MDILQLSEDLGCSEDKAQSLLTEYGLSLDGLTQQDIDELRVVLEQGSAIVSQGSASQAPIESTKSKAPKSGKLAKGKESKPAKISQSKKAENLESGFDAAVVVRQAAEAGYNSETFAVAGQAFLLGGRQRMLETISAGVSQFAIGAKNVFGSVDLENTDVWGDISDDLHVEVDVWG